MIKKLTSIISAGALFVLPVVASAGTFSASNNQFGNFLGQIILFINNIIIPFILGIGFLFFVWGMFLYFIKGAADEDAQEKGKSVLIYTIAGFVLIFIFWGIVGMLAESTGLQQQNLELELPNAIVPGG